MARNRVAIIKEILTSQESKYKINLTYNMYMIQKLVKLTMCIRNFNNLYYIVLEVFNYEVVSTSYGIGLPKR